MKLLVNILSGVAADYGFTAKRRWQCIRHGHALLCITDGHVCRRCGRFWD